MLQIERKGVKIFVLYPHIIEKVAYGFYVVKQHQCNNAVTFNFYVCTKVATPITYSLFNTQAITMSVVIVKIAKTLFIFFLLVRINLH